MRDIESRRAIESLRSGVPSAAAVRTLGCGQASLERTFRKMLEGEINGPGLVVRGGFGEGKSHLLTCLDRVALDEGFASSRVVISKEIQLSNPAKVLEAAVENLRAGSDLSRGLGEIKDRLLRRRNSGDFVTFKLGLERSGRFDSRFPATVTLLESAPDDELHDRILRFWSGDKLGVADIRRPLRELGLAASYPLAPIKARDLALQKLTFIPELVKAAGLKGWVLLVDEVELVGRYSRLSRIRAYAELARIVGQVPGLITVAAVTSDFAAEVLDRKGDRDSVPTLAAERYPDLAAPARAGMALIDDALLLETPTQDILQSTYDTLLRLHGDAYSWSPPQVTWPPVTGATPMRSYVRAWINAWDVRRLDPGSRADEAGYELSQISADYGESAAQEQTANEDAVDDQIE